MFQYVPNREKKNAIIAALLNPDGPELSDVRIATMIGVTASSVAKYRRQLEESSKIARVSIRRGVNGLLYDISGIGPRSAAQ